MSKLYFSAVSGHVSEFSSITDIVAANQVPILPSYTSGFDKELRIASVQFGNGYRQDAPDGINAVKLTVQVVFANRSKRVVEELCAFFEGGITVTGAHQYDRDPSEYFFWLPPAPFDVLIKVKCLKYSVVPFSVDVFTLTATFEQTFEI